MDGAAPIPELSRNSRVKLQPLVVRTEGNHLVVGRVDSGTFVSVPPEALPLFDMLRGHERSILDLESRLENSSGVRVNGTEFVKQLLRYGFVETIDGQPVSSARSPPSAVHWQRLGKWTFSRQAQVAYLVVIGLGISTVLVRPSTAPTEAAFFWSPWVGLDLAVNTLIFLAVVGLHEAAHSLAARSYGLQSRISISTRWADLVFQTEIPSIWAIPRTSRFLIYSAGLEWTAITGSVAVLLSQFVNSSVVAWSLLRVTALLAAVQIVWQLQAYMRTDAYYMLADALDSTNLLQRTLAFMRNLFGKLRDHRGESAPSNSIGHEREKGWVLAWYAAFLGVGVALAIWMLIVLAIPILYGTLSRAFVEVTEGAVKGNLATFSDGVAIWCLTVGVLVLTLYVFLRDRRRARSSRNLSRTS